MKSVIKKCVVRHIIRISMMFFLFSCVSHIAEAFPGIWPSRSDTTLDQWIDADLVPYLLIQLSGHPRFRGQPFLIVGIKESTVQAEINGVTRHIREKMVDALLVQPGIKLVWKPAVDSLQHNRLRTDVVCMPHEKIRFYIGIDTEVNPVDHQLHVKVRALDIDGSTWISGFGRSFSTEPGETALAAIQRRSPDEFLRGLRPLPFTDSQPDLAASYLALHLACLFSRQPMDDLVVYVEKKEYEGWYLSAVTRLLNTYLSQFSSVTVTVDPDKANVIIQTAIHVINGNLHQIWVTAKKKQNGEYLAGVETQTYVTLDTTAEASPNKLCAEDGAGESRHTGRFLISQDEHGRLTRLMPSECRGASGLPAYTGRIYAISVSDPLLAIWFNDKVRDLQGVCRNGEPHVRTRSRSRIPDFEHYLDFISEKTSGKLVYNMEVKK